jgi:tetrahydromethanopterin S-methyltransferase subunit C
MSALSSGAGSGLVFGLVAVLLAQQFGYVDLSHLTHAIEYLVVGAIVGAVLGAIIGWGLGRRYLSAHPAPPS